MKLHVFRLISGYKCTYMSCRLLFPVISLTIIHIYIHTHTHTHDNTEKCVLRYDSVHLKPVMNGASNTMPVYCMISNVLLFASHVLSPNEIRFGDDINHTSSLVIIHYEQKHLFIGNAK